MKAAEESVATRKSAAPTARRTPAATPGRKAAATPARKAAATPRSALRAKRSSVRRARKETARAETPMAFWVILATVGVLCLLGLIMVLSVTTVKSTYEYDTAGYFFNKQAIFLAIGTVLMYVGYKFGYRRIAVFSPIAMATSIGLLIFVLLVGERINGSRRWFNIGFFNVQPSEIAKLACILWAARLLANRSREMDDWRRTILPVAIGLGANLFLILLEPDLGTVVVLCGVVGLMLVVAGARLDVLAVMTVPVVLVLAYSAFTGYHAQRWGFLNPLEHGDSSNYQLVGSLSSVATGGWFGVGPGASMAKWGFLPEAHTDAIFAVITEETGVMGALAVIFMYVVLLGAGMRVARDAADAFGRLLAIGISSLLAVQAFVNIGVALGVLPNKGFTLPFVSYGGSSLLVMLFAVGLLLSVAREGSTEKARIRRREAMLRRQERQARQARQGPRKGRLVAVGSESRSSSRSTTSPKVGRKKRPSRPAPANARRTAPSRTAPSRAAASRTAPSRTAPSRTVKRSSKARADR